MTTKKAGSFGQWATLKCGFTGQGLTYRSQAMVPGKSLQTCTCTCRRSVRRDLVSTMRSLLSLCRSKTISDHTKHSSGSRTSTNVVTPCPRPSLMAFVPSPSVVPSLLIKTQCLGMTSEVACRGPADLSIWASRCKVCDPDPLPVGVPVVYSGSNVLAVCVLPSKRIPWSCSHTRKHPI
jgi:hypothetical protein